MSFDVLVVGGGPAGAAAARLLALWGHDVRLIDAARTFSSANTLAESLPPSCGKLLDLLGVTEAVDRAGFVRSTGNTVWWGSDVPRVEHFEGHQHGWQIERARFAAVLLDAARKAGVDVEERRVEPGRGAAALCAVGSAKADAAATPFVVDCTGRSGVIAKARGWRVYEPSLRTVALVGSWRRSDIWPIPDGTHTLIESYADGWAWSVPFSDGARHIAVMVDPRTTDLQKAQPAREIYLAEIAKTRQFAALARDATLEGGPWGWDASMYHSTRYADDRALLAGDAASFIDPLSSAGVKKALASGWLAAVAAHTALRRPAMREIAFEFFAARERQMYERFHGLTRRFLADAAAASAHPFWSDRAEPIEGGHVDDGDAAALARDPAVQAEFARLREAPALLVRAAHDVRVEPRASVSGCEVVLEARLIVPDRPEGLRYLCAIDVVALLELAPAMNDVGQLFDAHARRSGAARLPDFLLVLSTMLARGWLKWRA